MKSIKIIFLIISAILILSSFFWFKYLNNWITSHNKPLSAWSSFISIIAFPVIIISLFLGYHQIRNILVKPAIELEFVHPSSVSYKAVNTSIKIAEDILVSFGIFDIDSHPLRHLPIPSRQYNYVNKLSEKGPFSLFGEFGVEGHRYFGIVYVGCKGCRNLETYWIYVKHGHPDEGFYSKRNKTDTFEINGSRLINETDRYLEDLIPEERRAYIRD